ncbi:ABC transporter ATP-binding protein [Nocardioides taihuensis]|uniref:ABC transporter ATP-binding protein n=1 Tax=Nocardioides taihuensis TaxID=1835606 RepID=A0ABW0BJU5_9ACTN
MDAALQTTGLRKVFRGGHVALRGLDLEVPRGSVFGYLGPNGAGKTTTIRLATGLLRPTAGSVRVLGLELGRDPDRIQERIGYLPGRFVAYADLTVSEYLTYLSSLRGSVEPAVVDRLLERFEVDPGRRIAALSHGNVQKVGIVQAFMHRPDLVVLDEPTTGLDPLMQQEFLALLLETAQRGGTVFLSSHVLSEVAAAADTVAILREGALVTTSTVTDLRSRMVRRWDLAFLDTVPTELLRSAPGVEALTVQGRVAHLTLVGPADELLRRAAPYGVENVTTHEGDLTEVFLRFYDREEQSWPA